MTIRDLLTAAYRKAGILGAGTAMSATQGATGLDVLTDLLDRWAAERLTIASVPRVLCPLVTGQQRYTLGPGGNWNTARPIARDWVERAGRLTVDGLEIGISLLTQPEWERIPIKTMRSTLPEGLYIDVAFPLAQVDVWPVPLDATVQIVLYAPVATLTAATSLETLLVLAPGWSTGLKTALAVDLAVEYGTPVTADMAGAAAASKAILERPNQLAEPVTLDPFLTRRTGGSLSRADFLSGDF